MTKRVSGELIQINYHDDGEPHRVKSVWQNQDGILVEFIPVVRCKDCIHYKPYNWSPHSKNTKPYCCRSALIKVTPDDFCSYGERRIEHETN